MKVSEGENRMFTIATDLPVLWVFLGIPLLFPSDREGDDRPKIRLHLCSDGELVSSSGCLK